MFLLEVGAINPYWRYGDTAITSPHVLLVSRDCMPQRLKMRRENGTWHNAAVNVPWVGCALYATLNDEAYGVLPLVAGTDIGAYLYNGPNNRGMRYRGETKAIGVATATNYEWIDRGKLFLPSEREVRGADVWSEHIYGGAGLSLQWPIFRDSLLHVRKGLGDGGTGTPWPTLSTSAASATQFVCNVDNGLVGGYQAGTSGYSPPLCLLIA